MQVFVKTLTGRTVTLDLPREAGVEAAKAALAAKEGGVPAAAQRLIFAGRQLEDGALLAAYGVTDESTLHLVLSLDGGAKKRKKKIFTTPKVIPHKHKTIKLSVLKYYKVDDKTGKVSRLRKECPNEDCGNGVFMATHIDRYYCGRCHLTFQFEAKA
jgi:small subunit ribosomal protein S27Ae